MDANTALYVLAALSAIGGAVAIFLATRIYEKKMERFRPSENVKQPKLAKWPAVILFAVSLTLVIGASSFKVVPTGYTGVKTTFGMIDETSCMPGFNPITPFVQSVSLVNNKQQDIRFEERIWSETSEQTAVYMEGVAVSYQIVPEASAWIYANVDNWVEKLIDLDIVSSACKTASRQQPAEKVTNRAVIEPASKAALQKTLDDKYGPERIIVKAVIINNIDFDESYNQAIAERSAAMQKQQQQTIENAIAIEKAEADAEAARKRAQGEADAELIVANGKAKAAEVINGSVTGISQRQNIIDKWDGQLPRYVGEGGSFGILDAIDDTP